MRKKKLLIVSQHYYPENFRINDIAKGFIEDGFDVDVLCGLPNYPDGEWFAGYSSSGPLHEIVNGTNIFRAREIRRKGNTSLRIFLNYVSWPIMAFFRLLRMKESYDAIFCYNTSPVIMCFPAIRASKKFKAPLTTYVLDLWPENLYSVLSIKSSFLRNIACKVSNWHYRRANKLIAVSETQKKRLEQRVEKEGIPIYVVPQHAEDFYAVPQYNAKLSRLFEGKTLFLFTGNFSPAQNLEGAIRATAQAYDHGFADIHLLLIGSGMSQASIENAISEANAEDLVTIYGRVEAKEIPMFTAMADATLVSLSAHSDFDLVVPAKVASCMAAGKPIIASLDGEGAKAVLEAQCGFVAPAGDEDLLCDRLLEFSKCDQSKRERMGGNAKDYYKKNYSRTTVIRDLENIIFSD